MPPVPVPFGTMNPPSLTPDLVSTEKRESRGVSARAALPPAAGWGFRGLALCNHARAAQVQPRFFSPPLPVSAKLAAIIGRRRPLRLQATAHTAGLAARKAGRVQFRVHVVPSSKWLWNPNRPAGWVHLLAVRSAVCDGWTVKIT
jgi:hypothetical protein